MTRFFAGVLSVIAMGVLLIAYGLLNPRAEAFNAGSDRAAGDRGSVGADLAPNGYPAHAALQPQVAAGYAPAAHAPAFYAPAGYAPVYAPAPAPQYVTYPAPAPAAPVVVQAPAAQPVQTVVRAEGPRAAPVERRRGRDWKKTTLVIGGSTATGAGVGAIFGGKKGALIGAAIGGGGSTIYEATKR
jgi:hypothetical protein